MRNTEKKNMQRKLDELKRITGLSFSLDLPDTTDLPEAEAEETESYLLHQLDSLIASYKEVNSKEAIYKKMDHRRPGDSRTHSHRQAAACFSLGSARSLSRGIKRNHE